VVPRDEEYPGGLLIQKGTIIKPKKGNLPTEEYRFWIGSSLAPVDSSWAMCRCCRKTFNTRHERLQHIAEQKFTEIQCTRLLVSAYKRLLLQPLCIVCEKLRDNSEKWGVPLCASPSCEARWKFSQVVWSMLTFELQRQRNLVLGKEESLQDKARAAIVAQGYQPITRRDGQGRESVVGWCEMCCCCTDNTHHPALHLTNVQLKAEGKGAMRLSSLERGRA
jgi:hypothetical protein